jgi:hypothetical protein
MKHSFLYAGALSALALITMPDRASCAFVGNLSDAVQGGIIGAATAVNWINYGNAAPVAAASPAVVAAPVVPPGVSQGIASNTPNGYGPANYQEPNPDPEENAAIQREAAELMSKHTRN